MIDDVYQTALAAVRHHLDVAGCPYAVDDGEIIVDQHRLGLSISFDGFVSQGAHTLAPLDIQIHLDGDDGDRFRVGTLGVGADQQTAVQEAISEWHLLAVAPLLAALGAPVDKRRPQSLPQRLAGWDLFAGRVCIRGQVPPTLRAGSEFYGSLLARLGQLVAHWEHPRDFQLRSTYVMATRGPDACEIQAAVDGLLDENLIDSLAGLKWPVGGETYLYKQLFVLRSSGAPA